jgi:hypothetical protein
VAAILSVPPSFFKCWKSHLECISPPRIINNDRERERERETIYNNNNEEGKYRRILFSYMKRERDRPATTGAAAFLFVPSCVHHERYGSREREKKDEENYL